MHCHLLREHVRKLGVHILALRRTRDGREGDTVVDRFSRRPLRPSINKIPSSSPRWLPYFLLAVQKYAHPVLKQNNRSTGGDENAGMRKGWQLGAKGIDRQEGNTYMGKNAVQTEVPILI